MTKALSLVIIGMMVVHLIKPLGLPGLKKRGDFWKLPLAGLVVLAIATAFQF